MTTEARVSPRPMRPAGKRSLSSSIHITELTKTHSGFHPSSSIHSLNNTSLTSSRWDLVVVTRVAWWTRQTWGTRSLVGDAGCQQASVTLWPSAGGKPSGVWEPLLGTSPQDKAHGWPSPVPWGRRDARQWQCQAPRYSCPRPRPCPPATSAFPGSLCFSELPLLACRAAR